MDKQEILLAVNAKYPDVKLAFQKQNSYTDVREDMFTIWKGENILGFVNAKDTTPYLIIKLVEFYLHAYRLAEERTEERIRDAIGEMFKFNEDGEDC
jgi:hypothetical protein